MTSTTNEAKQGEPHIDIEVYSEDQGGQFLGALDERGKTMENMLSPEARHSDLFRIKLHFEILPGHISSSFGIYLHRELLKSTENPKRSEKHFVLSRSDPDPPALNSQARLDEYNSVF